MGQDRPIADSDAATGANSSGAEQASAFHRGISVLLVLILLAAVAAIRRPAPSAAETPGPAAAASADRAASPSDAAALLGEMVGRHYRVRLLTTAQGIRYDILTLRGVVLAEQLTGEELYRAYPELDLDSLQAAPSLMLVDEPRF